MSLLIAVFSITIQPKIYQVQVLILLKVQEAQSTLIVMPLVLIVNSLSRGTPNLYQTQLIDKEAQYIGKSLSLC